MRPRRKCRATGTKQSGTKEVIRPGTRTTSAENGELGGMHGRRGRLRNSGGAETGTHGMDENAHESTAYETWRAMYRRGRKQTEGERSVTAVHKIKIKDRSMIRHE